MPSPPPDLLQSRRIQLKPQYEQRYKIATVPCHLPSPSPSSVPRFSSSSTSLPCLGNQRDHNSEVAVSCSPKLVQVGTDGRTFKFVEEREGTGSRSRGKWKPQSQNEQQSFSEVDRTSLSEVNSITSVRAHSSSSWNNDGPTNSPCFDVSLLDVTAEVIAPKKARSEGLEEEEMRTFVFDESGKLQMKSRSGSRSSASRSQINSNSSSGFVPADKSLKTLKTLQGNDNEEAIILPSSQKLGPSDVSSVKDSPRRKMERMETERPRSIRLSKMDLQNWVEGVKGELHSSPDPNPEPSVANEKAHRDHANNVDGARLPSASSARNLSGTDSPAPSEAEALASLVNSWMGDEASPSQPASRTSQSTPSLVDSNNRSNTTSPSTTVSTSALLPNPDHWESSELRARKSKILSDHHNRLNRAPNQKPAFERSDSGSGSFVTSSDPRASSRDQEAIDLSCLSLQQQFQALPQAPELELASSSQFNPSNPSRPISLSNPQEDISSIQDQHPTTPPAVA